LNFFEHQEVARRSTRRLVILFTLAVIAIVLAVNVAAAAIYLSLVAQVGFTANAGTLPAGFFVVNP